jgi:hypothetical protein
MTTLGVILAVVITFGTVTEPIPGRYNDELEMDPSKDDWWDPVPDPFVIEGYRFTPSKNTTWILPNETDVDDMPWMYLSPWLAFEDYVILEKENGGSFNFIGFDSTGMQNGPATATSSNGDTLHYVTLKHRARHYEVNWQNVEWVRFDIFDFRHDEGPNGFDNIRVSAVPEPGTLWLIGIAGLLFFAVTRKLGWQ